MNILLRLSEEFDRTYLIVVAHPDDEVLGAGATMYKLAKEGHSVREINEGHFFKSNFFVLNHEMVSFEESVKCAKDAEDGE